MFGLYPVEVVRDAENRLMSRVPDGALMQLAARGLAVQCLRFLRDVQGHVVGTRVVILVGAGNNGGDALFAAAYLAARGMSVVALCVADSHHENGARALESAGGRLVSVVEVDDQVRSLLVDADLVIDGIVGIGAHGALREPSAEIVRFASGVDALRVAVDLPSGVDADTGAVSGAVFNADVTVTFGCFKPGLLLSPGREYVGAVHEVDIGLEPELPEPTWLSIQAMDVADIVAAPAHDDHKYLRGVVAVAAGSEAYPGAALLTVGSSRYSGAGMVRFLDRADGVADLVVSTYPDVVLDRSDMRQDPRIRGWACGPGFTESDAATVEMVLGSDASVVLDAGALQCLADDAGLASRVRERGDRGLTTVLTPHAGEFQRLAGAIDHAATPADMASELQAIVVLKGPGTTISTPRGGAYVDTAGIADLACAGSGDVLTGLLAGMLAAYHDDEPAMIVAGAVWLHGTAARIARRGGRPIVATDVCDAIPEAIAAARSGDLAGLLT
jgi:hydroxyethylthiazole kinase-like uncharacterized protein yjeF